MYVLHLFLCVLKEQTMEEASLHQYGIVGQNFFQREAYVQHWIAMGY